MKIQVYKANERGEADYGWLKAKYSFSFAHYYDQHRLSFGALRVLNDDIIDAGTGFGEHPHDNMEIITIPLEGALKHKDSLSNQWITLQTGEVQVMSAGTGLMHAERNNSTVDALNLFQIWILPNKRNVKPKYAQKIFDLQERKNKLQILVSSIDSKVEGSLTMHQDALISRIDLDENDAFEYLIKSESHGAYILVIEGEIKIDSQVLSKRDAAGLSNTKAVVIQPILFSELLIIEVPFP